MTAPAAPRPAPWVRTWLAPPFAAFVFLIPLLTCLARPSVPLGDPGTGWHLVAGRWILEHRAVPDRDMFSFTVAGTPEVNFYWLFETAAAALVAVGGLPLFAAACVLAYAAIPVLLYGRMLRIGAGIAPAFLATLLAYTVLLSHALTRPHLVTYVCFALLLDALDRYQRGRASVRGLWWVPVMLCLWGNMHGGFAVGLVTIGLFLGVAGVRFLLGREPAERRRALGFGALLLLSLAATLVNPRGPALHAAVLQYLGMHSPGYFQEFRSPNFLSGGAGVMAFEALVLLLVVLLAQGRRLPPIEWVLLVFFLHQALASVRYMNLFAIVAAPIVAREATALTDARWPRFGARWRRVAAEQARLRSPRLYLPLVGAVFLALAASGHAGFPRDLDGLQLSPGAAAYVAARPERFGRMFNTDNVGGALIYRFWPRLRVFFDDRVQVYGDAFSIDKYLAVYLLKPNWREVLDEYGVTSAVVSSKAPIATLLRTAPGWEVAHADEQTTVFLRSGG